MRKHLIAMSAIVASLVAAPVFADGKIAVADIQAAYWNTDQAQKTRTSLEAQLKPQRDRMEALKKEIKALEVKFQKDGSVMSDKDKADLQKQGEAKVSEFQSLQQQMQKKMQDAQQDLLTRMGPKLDAVVEELRKAGGYEMILDRKATIGNIDPSVDLTKKITDKLNAAK